MSQLFSTFRLRELTFKNRVFVSPMCQYSSDNGLPTDWHLVHLGSRAVGGAALVMVEATAVSPAGRISPADSGIWSDEHAQAFKRITAFIKSAGAVPGVQLAHAGRKASTDLPWRGGKPVGREAGGWQTMGPSALPFAPGYAVPREMNHADIDRVVQEFSIAAERALVAGFEVVEIHAAHGYLLHEFLSPISNRRTDDYGASLANRMRFPLRVAEAVRKTWPAKWPVFVRISSTDWAENGWDLPQSIEFAKALKSVGIDLIDCSSGGNVSGASIPISPGYQVPFAQAIRQEIGIATGAVGLITEPKQAEEIISNGHADVVLLARELLHDPYWPLHAADELGASVDWPVQYVREIAKIKMGKWVIMLATVIHQFGEPKVLKVEEVPTPEPRGDEVLVKIAAAGINPSDVKNVVGKMHGTTLPRIPGRDFAGVVVKGPSHMMGREVWGTGGDIGYTRDGSHAEFLLLSRQGVADKPKAISMESAGSAGLVFVTAWSALVTAANLAAMESVVIIGAAGGVGKASVQIAKARKARVIGVVRSDQDIARVQGFGADVAINSRVGNLVDRVRESTGGRGADVVFDTSGMMFAEAVELAATNARIPVITAPLDGNATFNLRSLYRKTLTVRGVDTRQLDAITCAKLLAQMSPGFEDGTYKIETGRTFRLREAIAAYEQASKPGQRVLLRMGQ